MSGGKLIGIIVGVVCVVVIIIVMSTGMPAPDGGSGGLIRRGESEGKIAFKQLDGIHVINPDGTNEVRLTELGAFVWSADGRKIAYGVDEVLYVINADGTGKRAVRALENERPAPHCWLPDGRIVVTTGVVWARPGVYIGGGSVYTVRSDGSDLVKLGDDPGGGRTYALSLDGRKVVYLEEKADEDEYATIWVMNTDGTGRKQLVGEDLYIRNEMHVAGQLTWSPDGRKITFLQMSGGGGHPSGLWLINADGTDKVQLGGYRCEVGGWSADSGKLAIYDYGSGLFVISLSNMSRTKVSGHTDGYAVSWSPDGKRIVLFTDDGSMVVAKADGSGSSVIGYGYWPVWSPG